MNDIVERLRERSQPINHEAAAEIERLRMALRPFALAAQKGSNVYTGVQMAMKDRPDLFSYSTAYVDAGRSAAHSHLSWYDYLEAKAAFESSQELS